MNREKVRQKTKKYEMLLGAALKQLTTFVGLASYYGIDHKE